MVISRLPSGGGGSKELHGASILVTVSSEEEVAGQTVELYKDSTLIKSGKLSADSNYLFADILDVGTYKAVFGEYESEDIEITADVVINKITKNVEISTTVTITLTLEGAKEDNITITDKDGATVGTCIFPTGGITGTVEIAIIDGDEYTFTSSVAKATDKSGKSYSKKEILTMETDIVRVLPTYTSENIGYGDVQYLPWYGNRSGGWEVVPKMTSDTEPYGVVRSSSLNKYTSTPWPYRVFDDDDKTNWSSDQPSDHNRWVSYEFIKPVCVKIVDLLPAGSDKIRVKNFSIEGSNDNNNWTAVYTDVCDSDLSGKHRVYEFNNDKYYKYYRIFVVDTYWGADYNYSVSIYSLQFYGIGS